MKRFLIFCSVTECLLCLGIHIGTFFQIVSMVWLLPAILLFGGIILLHKWQEKRGIPRQPQHSRLFPWVGILLFVYAIGSFIYVYRVTGGANSVELVQGHYVAMNKQRVIRILTEREADMYPNLWTRCMSAWIGAIALFTLPD